jgi:hypothetical protein
MNPRSDTRKTTAFSTVASLRCGCATSLLNLRRSRDPSLLLRDPSVYSCLATSEARQGEVRLGTAELGSAQRKHHFIYCCVITGMCFEVTVLAWSKYATLLPP